MNILLLTIHPNPESLSHQFSKIVAQELAQKGHTIDIINLYQDERGAFSDLSFGTDKKPANDVHLRAWREEKIKNTDKIIVFAPIWRSDLPAKFKTRYENVFTSGFAYRYTSGGRMGLLKGKRFQIIATCDAPAFLYHFFPFPLSLLWWGRLQLPGIRLDGVKVFGNIHKKKKSKASMDHLFLSIHRFFER